MSSVKLEPKPESTEVNLSPLPSNPESAEGTASISIPIDQSGQKAETSVPKATAQGTTSEITEKRRLGTLLARSFRVLGSALGCSMISESFKSKYKMRSEQRDGCGHSEWADVVDNVVESDNESESIDSYIEFMRHRDVRRLGDVAHGGTFVWFAKRKMEQQRENDVDEDNESNDDVPNDDSSESECFIPWFGSNFGSGQ